MRRSRRARPTAATAEQLGGQTPEDRVDGGTVPIEDADHVTQTWNALTEQVQAFIRAWETGPAPPDPGAFALAEPAVAAADVPDRAPESRSGLPLDPQAVSAIR